ncbi:hypothetical protein CHARACLAT_011815 [Characodon lateralis]|uniref:Uncharacterized protein n=1 Tax=Characodon lateralis TaxID=208331 RepID=A0ABU7F2P7_9TELE|nr:hypothetical protein [Characodon lateralis]
MKAPVQAARRIPAERKRVRGYSHFIYKTHKEAHPARMKNPDFLASRHLNFPRPLLLRLLPLQYGAACGGAVVNVGNHLLLPPLHLPARISGHAFCTSFCVHSFSGNAPISFSHLNIQLHPSKRMRSWTFTDLDAHFYA